MTLRDGVFSMVENTMSALCAKKHFFSNNARFSQSAFNGKKNTPCEFRINFGTHNGCFNTIELLKFGLESLSSNHASIIYNWVCLSTDEKSP